MYHGLFLISLIFRLKIGKIFGNHYRISRWRGEAMTFSNELTSNAFFTNPQIKLTPSRTPDIRLSWWNSPNIMFNIFGTSETHNIESAPTFTLLSILKGTTIHKYIFQSVLLVQLRQTQEGVLAETWLEGVNEYGTGQDVNEAVTDLIVSLGEYLEVLKEQQNRLSDSAKLEYDTLNKLITQNS